MAVPALPALLAALGLGGYLYANSGDTPAPAGAEVVPPRTPDVAAGDAGSLPGLDLMRQIWADRAAADPTTPRPASPALTPGASIPAPQQNTDQQTPDQQAVQQNSETDQSPQSNDGRNAAERLANFGFAMAASRNPSLFGQIGEAGLAMMQGDRQSRREALQARELDVMQEYRRAQIRVAEAEAAYQRDPNNPLNIARLAQARLAMARGVGGGGGGGSTNEGPGIPVATPNGGFGIFYPRTGRIAAAPEGVRPMGTTANTPDERRVTDRATRRAQFVNDILSDPATASRADELVQRWDRFNPPIPAAVAPQNQTTPAIPQPDRIIDLRAR